MSKKRTIDSFFQAPPKKPRTEETAEETIETTNHVQYPFPITNLPPPLASDIVSLPARPGKEINDQPDLDLLYFKPYIPPYMAKEFFEFLRSELPFYRVEYDIKRGGISTHIKTPRWTTVFGLDETSRFDEDGIVVDSKTGAKATDASYNKYPPRPIPQCLDGLRKTVESATGCKFNFCLVNYYASGSDSISYHSDDERFLGPNPAIASFSLGARRDFLMKHKPVPSQEQTDGVSESKPLKLQLVSGEMVLMRGSTQSKWLHSIPKRTGKNQDDGGRINITFRRAVIKEGTNNYYNYNVGSGPVYRWNAKTHEMTIWQS